VRRASRQAGCSSDLADKIPSMPEAHRSKFDLPFKIIVAAVAFVFSIEIHELVHLSTARLLGIPAHFLNLMAVGIPAADVPKYPAGALAVMNGIAPLFSFVVLGCGSYFWLKWRPLRRSWSGYFLTWMAILNLPYLGLQMMSMGAPSSPNGGGNDFSTVSAYLGAGHVLRAWLAVIAFVLYIMLQAPLRGLLYLEDRTNGPHEYKPVSRFRMILGWAFLAAGVSASLAACRYDIIQKYSQAGVLLLSQFGFWALACASSVSWRSNLTRALCRQWLVPCVIATLVLAPLGNDYWLLWLFVSPMVLGGIYFRARAESSLAPR
jgi:hypothetical protein